MSRRKGPSGVIDPKPTPKNAVLPYLGRWIGCEATAYEQGTKCYSNMTKLSAVAWTTPRYSLHMNAQRIKMLMIAPQMCFPTHLLILRLLSTPSMCCVVQPGTRNMRHNAFHGRWKGPRVPALWNTQGTPTYTHRFPCVRGSPGRPVPFLSVSPLCARTPSTRHRITRAARVRAPSAENRSYVQKFSVSPLLVLPRCFHTHTCSRFLFLRCKPIAPTPVSDVVVRLFDFPFPG